MAAADTILRHSHLATSGIEDQATICTVALASTATAAKILINLSQTAAVLLLLAGTASATHTGILDGTAKRSELVALEMVQADINVSIHNGTAYLCILDIFSTLYRDLNVISTFQTIGW